ncbi:hypothetical protein D3C77_708390 [compost metagenome]
MEINVFLLFQQEVEPLQEYQWIQKTIGLLLEQSEQNQQKAFHILKEIFKD